MKLYDYLAKHSSIFASTEFSKAMHKHKRPETISVYAYHHDPLPENIQEYFVELFGG
jgi:hypothetical protein